MKIKLPSIPQLSLLIIILALLKIFIYYNHFNIPIKYYIGITELGLLIADDLFLLIPIVLVMYFFNSIPDAKNSKEILDTSQSDKATFLKYLESKKIYYKSSLDKVMFLVFIIILLLVFLGGPVYMIIKAPSSSNRIMGILMLVVVLYFIIFIARYEELEKIFTSTGMIISIFIALFLLMFVTKTAGEIRNVEQGAYKGTKIITSDSTYVSSDTAYYIGQTSQYLFFYNKQNKHTTIIPVTEVKQIELYLK